MRRMAAIVLFVALIPLLKCWITSHCTAMTATELQMGSCFHALTMSRFQSFLIAFEASGGSRRVGVENASHAVPNFSSPALAELLHCT